MHRLVVATLAMAAAGRKFNTLAMPALIKWPLAQVEVPPAWGAAVAAAGLAPLPWRKSSEYFTLIRPHAELAANDTAVDALFAQRLCADAEHEFR